MWYQYYVARPELHIHCCLKWSRPELQKRFKWLKPGFINASNGIWGPSNTASHIWSNLVTSHAIFVPILPLHTQISDAARAAFLQYLNPLVKVTFQCGKCFYLPLPKQLLYPSEDISQLHSLAFWMYHMKQISDMWRAHFLLQVPSAPIKWVTPPPLISGQCPWCGQCPNKWAPPRPPKDGSNKWTLV